MDGNQNQQPNDMLEQQMEAEMENSRLIEEQQARMAAATAEMDAKQAKKDNKGLMIGLIVAIVVALCGVGFGVLMMVLRTNDASDYEAQIAALTKTNSALTTQLEEQTATAGEIDETTAMKILEEELGYVVEYVRIDQWYEDEDGAVMCEVSYLVQSADGTLIEDTALIAENEDGTWGVVHEYMDAEVDEGEGADVVEEEVIPEE